MPGKEEKPRPRLIESKAVRPNMANRGSYGPGKKRNKSKGDGKSLCINSKEKKEGKMTLKEKMSEKKLETRTFADEKTAIEFLMKDKDRGHCSLKHSLSTKQKTPEVMHKSDTWIILPSGTGRCIIAVEGYLDEIFDFFQSKATAVLVPAGSKYYLEGLSANIAYSTLSWE